MVNISRERLSVLKQEMSRISKLQADLLRLRKGCPDDGQIARQLANTGKLYEEAKKRATAVGKLIDGLGQEIFKIPQKIKLLAMEHEDKFHGKIEAIKKANKERAQVGFWFMYKCTMYSVVSTVWLHRYICDILKH